MNLETYKNEAIYTLLESTFVVVFKSELVDLMKYLRSFKLLLASGKLYNGSNTDMSYVNILNGGDPTEIALLEKYLGSHGQFEKYRGHVAYIDATVQEIHESTSIDEIDAIVKGFHG